jgi:Icc-related predicted phosphoesterase
MKILHLSDTHGKHRLLTNLPKADIIIHSGDMCFAGTASEFSDFADWFCELDYPYKIFIAGNHDIILHEADAEKMQSFFPENIAYLYNSGVEIEGLKFWGVPFMFEMPEKQKPHQEIPPDIDVLITHNPPYCILDFSENIHYGCVDLLGKVLYVKPKYHLFGHIHDAYGIEKSKNTTFVNAAVMNEAYELVNSPVLIEI